MTRIRKTDTLISGMRLCIPVHMSALVQTHIAHPPAHNPPPTRYTCCRLEAEGVPRFLSHTHGVPSLASVAPFFEDCDELCCAFHWFLLLTTLQKTCALLPLVAALRRALNDQDDVAVWVRQCFVSAHVCITALLCPGRYFCRAPMGWQ